MPIQPAHNHRSNGGVVGLEKNGWRRNEKLVIVVVKQQKRRRKR